MWLSAYPRIDYRDPAAGNIGLIAGGNGGAMGASETVKVVITALQSGAVQKSSGGSNNCRVYPLFGLPGGRLCRHGLQRSAALPAKVRLPGAYAVVPDAGELVGTACTAVRVAAQTPGLQTLDAELVTTLRGYAEEGHHRAPLAPVGCDPGAEQAERQQVGDLVGHRLGKKLPWMPR